MEGQTLDTESGATDGAALPEPWVKPWRQDGHLLRIVGIEDEGYVKLEVVCPTEGCTAIWNLDESIEGYIPNESDRALALVEPCWLRYWVKEDDAWRESIEGKAEGNGPYPISWYWNSEYVQIRLEGATG